MTTKKCDAYAWVFCLPAVFCSDALAQGQYVFSEIVISQSVETKAIGINAAGQVVGTYATVEDVTSNIEHGYLLDGVQITVINFPDSLDTDANGINDNGDIVGTYADRKLRADHGYLVIGGKYASIDLPLGVFPDFNGINANGDLVGGYLTDCDPEDPFCERSGVNHGFLLSADRTFIALDFSGPGRHDTEAYGINQDGTVVGTYIFTDDLGIDHDLGFVRSTDGNYTSILFPGSSSTDVFGINNNGDIAGSYTDEQGDHGFVKLNDGAWIQLDFPSASTTRVSGINDAGQIVGNYETGTPAVERAFVANPG